MKSCTIIPRSLSSRGMSSLSLLGWQKVKIPWTSSGLEKAQGHKSKKKRWGPFMAYIQVHCSDTLQWTWCEASPAIAPSDLPQHSPQSHAFPGSFHLTKVQQGHWNQVIPTPVEDSSKWQSLHMDSLLPWPRLSQNYTVVWGTPCLLLLPPLYASQKFPLINLLFI